jgi:NTE family protein
MLGGFLRLSGYRPNQLRGQNLGFGRLIYYRKLWDLPRALGKGIYLGGSLEAGNAWAKDEGVTVESIKTGASTFLGADTIIGPLYLGYGYAGSSNNSLYLYLGKP